MNHYLTLLIRLFHSSECFPLVSRDAIDSLLQRNHICRIPQNEFAGEFPSCPHTAVLALAGLLLCLSTPALAQGGPPRPCRSPFPSRSPSGSPSGTNISGRFEAVASVEVRARVSGFIDKLHFRDGQCVNVGDLLFTIDKRPYRDRRRKSREADVARNKAQVDLAELQVEPRRGADRLAHHHRMRTTTSARRTSPWPRPSSRRAEAALRNAELNLDWTDVRAPLPAASPTARSMPAT